MAISMSVPEVYDLIVRMIEMDTPKSLADLARIAAEVGVRVDDGPFDEQGIADRATALTVALAEFLPDPDDLDVIGGLFSKLVAEYHRALAEQARPQ